MADTDTASYITRYNLVSLNPEYFNGSDWYPMNIVPGDLTLASGKVFVGSASGIATGVTLSGAVTITNAGVASLAAASVTGALLTGYSSGAGTVAATDSILQGINKLNGNQVAQPGIAVLASDPGTPTEGQVWYNSTSHLLKFYNGTAVKTVATV